MDAPAFSRTRDRLERELADGTFTKGVQLVVEHAGCRVLDLAVGDAGVGAPMTPDTVLRVYCTIKPVTAIAVACLIDAGALELDEPLEERLPGFRPLEGGVTLRHVLTHTAGLHLVQAVELEMLPPDRRRARIATASRPPGWRLGADAAYSEAMAWHVLGWVIESVAGEPLRDHLRRAVLDPLALDSTFVGMTRAQYERVYARLGVNYDLRSLSCFPMLFERSERVCLETNPAHGGYTNARDLARFYTHVLAALDGARVRGLPSRSTLARCCADARPSVYDEVLDRVCPYGLGFMTSLHLHAFGDACSPSSFGHSGYSGASLAFADPESSLAVAMTFNGVIGHESAFLRRRAIVRALYADLAEAAGEADGDTIDDGVDDGTEPRGRRPRWFRRA